MSHWQYFNWPEIVREAKLRLAQAQRSDAAAVTPEMRTIEYWTAWCAHANLGAVFDGRGLSVPPPKGGKKP